MDEPLDLVEQGLALGPVALAGLLVVAPIAVVFIVCQRYLVRGILAGSAKG